MNADREVLTFWPPDPQELRRWRRRMAAWFLGLTGVMTAVPLLALSVTQLRRYGLDLPSHLPVLGPLSAVGALLAVALGGVLPRATQWAVTRNLARSVEAVWAVLEPGERPRVACLALFLDAVYAQGLLVLTDRRLVRLHVGVGSARLATLGRWEELAAFERVQRRANRNRLFALILGAMGSDQGLRLTRRDGRSVFLVTDRFLLEPLLAWLEAQGHPVGFVNEEDLPPRPSNPAPTFEQVALPALRQRAVRLVVRAVLGFLVLVAVTAVAIALLAR